MNPLATRKLPFFNFTSTPYFRRFYIGQFAMSYVRLGPWLRPHVDEDIIYFGRLAFYLRQRYV